MTKAPSRKERPAGDPVKTCRDCKCEIEYLCDFPGPRCLQCHARKVDKEPLQRPDFRSAVKPAKPRYEYCQCGRKWDECSTREGTFPHRDR